MLRDGAQVVFGRGVIAVAGVAEQAAQTKPRQRRDRLHEPERVAVRIDAAAMESDVDFDQHVERASGALPSRRTSRARRPGDRR